VSVLPKFRPSKVNGNINISIEHSKTSLNLSPCSTPLLSTFSTSDRHIFCSTYLHQKDERVIPGNFRSWSFICEILGSHCGECKMSVFEDTASRSLVEVNWRFRGAYFSIIALMIGNTHVWNISQLQRSYTALYPRLSFSKMYLFLR
jgi:hypothetical protein